MATQNTAMDNAALIKEVNEAHKHKKYSVGYHAQTVVAVIVTLIMLFPLYWMIATSFKSAEEVQLVIPTLFPHEFHPENYLNVLQKANFMKYYWNTIVMTAGILLLQVGTGVLAAYGFAVGRFKGRNALFYVVLGALMIPLQVTFIPIYIMCANWNLCDTFLGLILPEAVSAYYIFMLRNTFMSIDQSYIDAGRIDGLSRLGTIWYVLVPMSKATIFTVTLVTFTNGWNAYFWPKIIAKNEVRRVLTVGLAQLKNTFAGQAVSNYHEIMAGAVLAIIPVVIQGRNEANSSHTTGKGQPTAAALLPFWHKAIKEAHAMFSYIAPGAKQYRANLHSHTNLSDGTLTPEQMVQAYQEKGYSILAITDHEAPYDHTALSTDDFLMLTGYEAYIRPSPTCEFDLFKPEIHLNLLAKDPHNTAIIGWDPNFCKYMPLEVAEHQREHKGNLGPRKYSREYIQRFIDTARASGYLVTYNHPCWSMEAEEDTLSYDGCFSLEVFNTGSEKISGYECNMALYDKFLRKGKFLYVHGADDNHNKAPFGDLMCDSFGSWTQILAEELTYPAVIRALEEGRFYATTGPEITELTFDGSHVRIGCSPAQRIVVHGSPKLGKSFYNPDGSPITHAELDLPPIGEYVYFSVYTADGKAAHTRAFRRAELAE